MTTSIEQILSEFRSKFPYYYSDFDGEGKQGIAYMKPAEFEAFLTSKLTEYGQEEYKRGYKEGVRDESTTKNGMGRYQLGYDDGYREGRDEEVRRANRDNHL